MKKSLRNYRLFFHRLGLLFFLLPVIVLVSSIILPDTGFSEKENRILASRPALKLDQIISGGYEKQFETYENDQFPLRDMWITLKATTDRLMGKVEENGVYLGKNGYLMEAFNAPSQTQYDATVNAMTSFAQKHPDLKQYALIAPNSVNILKSNLPAFAPADDQNPWIDKLKDSLTSAGVTFIDIRDTFTDHKAEDLYYHTDHHWTTLGAYYAYLQAAAVMGIDISSDSYDKAPVSQTFKGTLSAKSGFRSGETDELDVFLPNGDNTLSSVVNYVDEQKKSASFYDTSKLNTRDKYALFFGGNHAQIKISTPTESNNTLLVLKDSYANSFVPFLAQHYRKIIMIDPRYYYGDLEQLLQVENVQEVLYLYNANTFFADTSLELAL
ncbi:DHHW family protein [Blautia difficilis]|uniref:AlgX/AlgJ SGNH hydrolase-like domain-containing protein n=1 Tax=Blautia difficilis TaxID=2763027 RepID=A0ABR7IJR2_9FIRM|nr:DHHW family protein [Blautia difficilis]MBC5780248.1 hypothetical protein [Blautia difficilis]